MIDESLYTGKYNPDIPNFIQANEACKLLEEGVCSLEECDTAMELGYNMEGPIHYIQRFEPQQIADALNAVADHFGKEIFRPVATITTGTLSSPFLATEHRGHVKEADAIAAQLKLNCAHFRCKLPSASEKRRTV